ncbi:carotenoid-cleaving dioxygenase, mitochondrial-like [Lethenteron reissneri]|uniref:carotenoid-cleaving dioxygenase, mitochondrial-like n=1 Tax=Lethenteron reissneri TaxID=7753 RepID=UPI002AB6F3C8|nr:carotenoid-cleaving dioxygenase, mitochondrial-like [Lethenteron reissneri]
MGSSSGSVVRLGGLVLGLLWIFLQDFASWLSRLLGLSLLFPRRRSPSREYAKCSGLQCIAPIIATVTETPETMEAEIHGTIPAWIKGTLLRNGPGKFEFGPDSYNHWFDGMALMHRFRVHDGRVSYSSRFLRSDSYLLNEARQRIVVSEFGTMAVPDPCKTLFDRFFTYFSPPAPTDNDVVNYVEYKKDVYVSSETMHMRKVDPRTLDTKEKVDWGKFVAVNSATAHPHYDPDGTAYNMGNIFGREGTHYAIIRVPVQKDSDSDTLEGATIVARFPAADSRFPSYYHSFAMTENYVVFLEQPLCMDILQLLTSRLRGRSYSHSMVWKPQRGSIMRVANKHTGEILPVAYHMKAMMSFHHINAYEDDGHIVNDLCCVDHYCTADEDPLTLKNLRSSGDALDQLYNRRPMTYPRRFVMPLSVGPDSPRGTNLCSLPYTTASATLRDDGKVWLEPEPLHGDDVEEYGGLEFPRIHYERFNARPYRYFYSCGFQHVIPNSLIKVDVTTKETKHWQVDGYYPSEPVFVPSPGAEGEDEGAVLSVVISPDKEKPSFLLVLDASSFVELGRAVVPRDIPYGFHGIFAPNVV